MPYFSAMFSAVMPMWTRLIGQVRPSEMIASRTGIVAEPVAVARLAHEIRCRGHVLHAAGDDDVGVAASRSTARRARRPSSPEPQALLTPKLGTSRGTPASIAATPRGVEAETGGDHVAEDHLVDLLRVDAGATDRFFDGERTEFGRGRVDEGSAEGADGGRAALTMTALLDTGFLPRTARASGARSDVGIGSRRRCRWCSRPA